MIDPGGTLYTLFLTVILVVILHVEIEATSSVTCLYPEATIILGCLRFLGLLILFLTIQLCFLDLLGMLLPEVIDVEV